MKRRGSSITRFMVHTALIEASTGQDEDGASTYAAASPVACFVEETNRLVRSPNGSEVTSTAQAYCPAGTTVTLDSRITLPSGRVTQLLSIERHDSGTLGLPDHVTLNLE